MGGGLRKEYLGVEYKVPGLKRVTRPPSGGVWNLCCLAWARPDRETIFRILTSCLKTIGVWLGRTLMGKPFSGFQPWV